MKNERTSNSNKLRNIIIVSSMLMFIVPFISISNLYPFMRFGMFAEKVEPTKGIEIFEVQFPNKDKAISQDAIAIPPHMLSYLIRNYYYKGQIKKCAINLYQLTDKKTTIELYKLTIINQKKNKNLIYRYPNE
jgi:hypothetical protein